MAIYKSKYTGQEIEARLSQGTYDDAVKTGFKGTKEDFDKILGDLQETLKKVNSSQSMESNLLETNNKTIVEAINELYRNLQTKPNEQDVIDQAELDVFKDEIAAQYATLKQLLNSKTDLDLKINKINTDLLNLINNIKQNLTENINGLNVAAQKNSEAIIIETNKRVEMDTKLSDRITVLEKAEVCGKLTIRDFEKLYDTPSITHLSTIGLTTENILKILNQQITALVSGNYIFYITFVEGSTADGLDSIVKNQWCALFITQLRDNATLMTYKLYHHAGDDKVYINAYDGFQQERRRSRKQRIVNL